MDDVYVGGGGYEVDADAFGVGGDEGGGGAETGVDFGGFGEAGIFYGAFAFAE